MPLYGLSNYLVFGDLAPLGRRYVAMSAIKSGFFHNGSSLSVDTPRILLSQS
jgi:hypothetical protein